MLSIFYRKDGQVYDTRDMEFLKELQVSDVLWIDMFDVEGEEKRAVECGYWHLYRYNPQLEEQGKNPFILDSKEPDWSKFQDFLKGEVRFASLYKLFPERAEELLQKTEEFAKIRLNTYKKLAGKTE